MRRIEIYDTTLRDGNQTEGISFSVEDKLRIARELDRLGIHYIEGGYAGANSTDREFFSRAQQELCLENAQLVAFGSTRKPNLLPEEDSNLRWLLESGTNTVAVVGKSWNFHVERVLGTTLEENLAMISDSVWFLCSKGRWVTFDAEHFFDGYKANPNYALRTLRAAVHAGAERIVLCDTRGASFPWEIREVFDGISRADNDRILLGRIGIHTHNDRGMADANSLIAVKCGAVQVQGTFNGYGERCGNANLCTVIPNLKLSGFDCISQNKVTCLTEASRLISEFANLPHDEKQPYVGKSAFAHKAGYHADGVSKDTRTYEHVPPETAGNKRRILVSHQSGRSAILMKLLDGHPRLRKNSPEVRQILDTLKQAESNGYQYEGAEASFELVVQRAMGVETKCFNLKGFTVLVERNEHHQMHSQATIKLMDANGNVEYQESEGHGPVDALNRALRKALTAFFPQLDSMRLTDFKVRVLDAKSGTAAKVRVLMESSDGTEDWGTVGVSENIIEASWEALVDSIEYWLLRNQQAQEE